jgi:hypothetical protein
MSHEEIDDRFHNNMNLKTANISTYIQQAFVSGDQTPVFSHVYPPVLGIQEVLLPVHHIPEALDLIKIIKTDLCRVMNHRAILKNFPDSDDLILSTTIQDSWQPFDIQLNVARSPHYYTNKKTMKQPSC